MNIIHGKDIELMTGYKARHLQARWFKSRGYSFDTDSKGNVWTTRDWMNGVDKLDNSLSDGFNLEFLQDAS